MAQKKLCRFSAILIFKLLSVKFEPNEKRLTRPACNPNHFLMCQMAHSEATHGRFLHTECGRRVESVTECHLTSASPATGWIFRLFITDRETEHFHHQPADGHARVLRVFFQQGGLRLRKREGYHLRIASGRLPSRAPPQLLLLIPIFYSYEPDFVNEFFGKKAAGNLPAFYGNPVRYLSELRQSPETAFQIASACSFQTENRGNSIIFSLVPLQSRSYCAIIIVYD